jgi:hypothetical protein
MVSEYRFKFEVAWPIRNERELHNKAEEMGINPIASIRSVSLQKPSKEGNSQSSVVTSVPADQMGDDTYGSSRDATDRNLKQERPDFDVEPEAGERADKEEGPGQVKGNQA